MLLFLGRKKVPGKAYFEILCLLLQTTVRGIKQASLEMDSGLRINRSLVVRVETESPAMRYQFARVNLELKYDIQQLIFQIFALSANGMMFFWNSNQ